MHPGLPVGLKRFTGRDSMTASDRCRLFVDSDDRTAVSTVIHATLGGELDGYCVTASSFEADIRRNDDCRSPATAIADAGFLFWATTVDFEAIGVDRSKAVDLLTRLLVALWSSGLRTVAACEFEDLLPWAGGIQRVRVEDNDGLLS